MKLIIRPNISVGLNLFATLGELARKLTAFSASLSITTWLLPCSTVLIAATSALFWAKEAALSSSKARGKDFGFQRFGD